MNVTLPSLIAVSVILGALVVGSADVIAQPPCSLQPDGTALPNLAASQPPYLNGATLPAGVLSLTYDDGPAPGTLALAQYLRDEGIRATFFTVGGKHDQYPDPPWFPDFSIVPQVTALGHRIANHTRNHYVLTGAAPDAEEQVCAQQEKIDPYISDDAFFFRAPGGQWDPAVANRLRADARLNRIFGPVSWDITSGAPPGSWPPIAADTDCALTSFATNEADCVWSYMNKVQTDLSGPPPHGGIVIMHDYIWRPLHSGVPNQAHPTLATHELSSTWPVNFARLLIPFLKERHFLLVGLDAVPGFPGGARFDNLALWSSNFSDVDSFGAAPGYYETIRLGDVSGDGRTDVCGRGFAGLYCNIANAAGTDFIGTYSLWHSGMSDALGWLPPQYSTSIQLGDIDADGDDDVCALGFQGILCARSTTTGFQGLSAWLPEAALPAELRTDVGYYGTVRLGDLNGDGKADLCFRAAQGVMCGLSNGNSFDFPVERFNTQTGVAPYSDVDGWLGPQYSTTVQLADLNGDGRFDICGRGSAGVYCALADGSGFFGTRTLWSAGLHYPNFSDYDGFAADAGYFRTVRLADVNGDEKADVCIRSSVGILCAESDGAAFEPYQVWQKADFADASGWLPLRYSSTLQFGDLNGDGKADVCGRGVAGVLCSLAR